MKNLIVLFVLFLTGCSVPEPYVAPTVAPKFINLTSENVKIVYTETMKEIVANQPIAPDYIYNGAITKQWLDIFAGNALNNSLFFRDVLVNVEGLEKPLFGKLLLAKVRADSPDMSAKRLYTISIPESYISSAKKGNIATIYQPYSLPSWQGSADMISWALYISSFPL
jgi:hypothetical protein